MTGGTQLSRAAPQLVEYPARRSPKPQRLGEGATLRPPTRCPLTRRRVPHPATPDYLGPDRGLPATTPHLVLVQRVQSRGEPASSSALRSRTRSPDRPRSGRRDPPAKRAAAAPPWTPDLVEPVAPCRRRVGPRQVPRSATRPLLRVVLGQLGRPWIVVRSDRARHHAPRPQRARALRAFFSFRAERTMPES